MSFTRFLATLLVASTLTACHAAPVSAVPVRSALRLAAPTGDWVMHLYVGQTHFADQLHLAADGSGTLTVVGKWSAPLEQVRLVGDELSFEVLAPEGPKPFRVFYRGQIKDTTMTGFATLADGSLLGGYVAQRQAP